VYDPNVQIIEFVKYLLSVCLVPQSQVTQPTNVIVGEIVSDINVVAN
jgi:hypothetical protein